MKTLSAAMLCLSLLVIGAGSSHAEMLSWIRFGGVCYGYHPRDPNHCLGRYYPYSGEYCRHLRATRYVLARRHVVAKRHVVKVAVKPAKALRCAKKRNGSCPVFKFDE
jgi:hypothetical protein